MPYYPNPQHRNTQFSGTKSQWIILIPEEEASFNHSYYQNWATNAVYWGLHLVNLKPENLGISPCNNLLFIAKFVSDQGNWHGYPVATWLSPFDKPDEQTLTVWQNLGLISAPKKSKIHRGKRCSL